MSEVVVKVENICFQYDKRGNEVIHDVSFQVQKGEWVSVIGDNGSGKSTIAKLLVGLVQHTRGQIYINQIKMDEHTIWSIRQHIGMVWQNPDNQFIGTTVEDDVAFSLENLNMSYAEMKDRVNHSLQLVGISELSRMDPSLLSGGQKQKVALAGVLALHPQLIILDEAFVMLDPKSRNSIIRILQELKMKEKLTIISITHDMAEAASADRIIQLRTGKVNFDGAPKDYFDNVCDWEVPVADQLRRLLITKGKELPRNFMTEAELVKWFGNSI
ncbi:energy-coupling factor transporter ATPase [Lederbergia graminis]|uniref:Energy-coupling factor transporter ATPase n=1 Tax=Lederbergia graminis TaxID=735518 RepID=A0ABW0LC12_9BACI